MSFLPLGNGWLMVKGGLTDSEAEAIAHGTATRVHHCVEKGKSRVLRRVGQCRFPFALPVTFHTMLYTTDSKKTPLKERLVGHKKLAYIIPLSSSRSSLAIFNETDLTLSLTTSASKLSDDLEDDFQTQTRSETTRGTGFKDRLRQSRQAKWLLNRKTGTQIFLVKFAERSRALDWYWQLWRDLGGELPTRLDVVVPAFSTTLRLPVPEDEYETGGRTTRAAMSPANVTRLAREAISGAVDTERLLQGRQDNLQLEIAWMSTGGRLDWVNWDTTVQGKKRDWAVLAGLARMQAEKQPEVLQLRPASHRVKAIKLQDGTVLDEPPGVEGYLTRHTGGSTPKEEIYASTHDGQWILGCRSQEGKKS